MTIISTDIPRPSQSFSLSRREASAAFASNVLTLWFVGLAFCTVGQIVSSEFGYGDMLMLPVRVPEWWPWWGGSEILFYILWVSFLVGTPVPVYLAAYVAKRLGHHRK